MSEGERRLAAIMFTDTVGYTSLTQSNESATVGLLEDHRKLVRPIFAIRIGIHVGATSGLSSSLNFADPKALSLALSSIAGPYAPYVFAVGLVAAAFLALVVISLGSSWAVVDTMGWQKSNFLWVYLAESLPAVAIPILYPEPLSLATPNTQ